MASKVAFTASRVAGFKCPTDKSQAFLWDATAPGLGLRITPGGKPSYVFQSQYQNKSIRITIGKPSAWNIPEAQAKARELQRIIDEGRDPREVKAAHKAAASARKAAAEAEALTVGEAWRNYVNERRPYWGELTYKDHLKIASEGGVPRKNRSGQLTVPGPLAPLLGKRLVDLTPTVIEAWASKEAKTRPARVRLALRLLKAFLRWAAQEEGLSGLVDPSAASGRKAREAAGKAKAKSDHLEREQLSAWFEYVCKIQNPVISAYLQCLLLTGARREELATLKWEDVNFQWRGITFNDKVEDSRSVPLTPYVASLLQSLPRGNQWVFSSGNSQSGRLVEPSIAHRRACQIAGISLTLHGLRRSFKSLSEWLDMPVGVIAQIMGHKPSATAEKHYTIRPLDLLRVHHEKLEAWILDEAGLPYVENLEQQPLQLIDDQFNQ